MAGERVVQTWYRCVMVEDGSLWCESSNQREVLLAGEQTSQPVRFETFSVIESRTPWTAFEPSPEALARAKQDAINEEIEMAGWVNG
jgi:hypothetical protein